jgi:RNA polymerase sigma factor (sigma-70 family)
VALDVESLYRRYGPMVLRRCRRLLRDEEKAVDAMQDTFVQLLRHAEDLDGSAPSSLLFRTATNVCLNRLRGERRRPEDPEDELVLQIAAADDLEGNTAARSLLGRIFGGEKESTRTIAVLHLVDGMTHEEVAREVNLSVSGVRKRLRTLRSRVAGLEGV